MKTKSKSKKKVKSVKNIKATFTVNNHKIKWSEKWKGWEVIFKNRLVQMYRRKEDAKKFALKGYNKFR